MLTWTRVQTPPWNCWEPGTNLSINRCDEQFETDACAKKMKQPTKASWTRMKRLARYLAGTQSARVALVKLGTDDDPHEAFLRVWSDRLGRERQGQEEPIEFED